jgi:hypothetical protein
MGKGNGDLKADGLLVWVEKSAPIAARVRFDLNRIAKSLESRFDTDSVILLDGWSALSKSLVANGAIEIESLGVDVAHSERIMPLIATHLQRLLTDEKAEQVPAPKMAKDEDKGLPASSWTLSMRVGYRLTKCRSLKKEKEILNLSVSQPIRRTLSISQPIPVHGP